MAIPDYQSLMLPLLQYTADGEEHHNRDAVDALAHKVGLTEEERKTLLPSGRQPTFDNRVGWARTYMKKAGLIEATRRGYFRITPRGQKVLHSKPEHIDVNYLSQFEEFQEFRSPEKDNGIPEAQHDAATDEATPEEALEQAYLSLRSDLASDLLQTVKQMPPDFFERLVVDLLVRMGYGGSRKEAGQALGKSGDEGIDGIIKEDRLGLDIIYLQAKRWAEGVVGRPEVQKFAGALQGKRAKKGIFLTTSAFTKEAQEYVALIDSKIILIDGKRLAELMIDHGVGVTPIAEYQVKRLDSDYFTES